MKPEAANHWKIKALGRALATRLGGGPQATLGGGALNPELAHRLAMGVMESLWIWCKRYYPRGDIGRVSDETIAENAGWDPLDAAWFIKTLIASKLIDTCDKHRLIVHDLSDHAEEWVKLTLDRQGVRKFADGRPVRKKDGPGRPRKEPTKTHGKSTRVQERGMKTHYPSLTSSKPSEPLLSSPSPSEPPPPSAAPPPPVADAVRDNRDLLAKRERLRASEKGTGIGSEAEAVGHPDYPAIRKALGMYWEGRQLDEISTNPNATLERVVWLIDTAESRFREGKMRTGRKGVGGYIRDGITGAYQVPPEWLAANADRFAKFRSGGTAA